MKNKRVYFFLGTTAELIKIAPVIKELNKRNIRYKVITSGQNKIIFDDLKDYFGEIKVHIAFKEKTPRSSPLYFSLWALKTLITGIFSLRREFKGLHKKNSYFIVHGDTISSLLGSIIAKFYGLKIVHVESGLRSFNFLEPIPEEICRFIITHIADILFAPNDWALNNLKGIEAEKVKTKENTLIESCLWAVTQKNNNQSIKKLNKYFILFMHRQEHIYFNIGWTRNIIETIISNAKKDLKCIIILHALTSRFLEFQRIDAISQKRKNIVFLPKLPYKDYIYLLKNSEFIATDSCTNQEEAYYLGVPYLGLRNLTERIEGLGQNVVISKGNKKIIKDFLKNYKNYKKHPVKLEERPSNIIVDYLLG